MHLTDVRKNISEPVHNPLACVSNRSDECDHAARCSARSRKMKSFTIENETNNIAVHATKRDAAAVANTQSFGTSEELADLAASWPGARLIKIWNSIPGNAPVAKFKDRATAVTRIWKAIQPLIETYDLADRASASVAEATRHSGAPPRPPSSAAVFLRPVGRTDARS
jgi:hypothetical protein